MNRVERTLILVSCLTVAIGLATYTAPSSAAIAPEKAARSPRESTQTARTYSPMSSDKATEVMTVLKDKFPPPHDGVEWELPGNTSTNRGINVGKEDWVFLIPTDVAVITENSFTSGLPEGAVDGDLVRYPFGLFASTVDLTVVDNACFRAGFNWEPVKVIKKGYYVAYAWQNGISLQSRSNEYLLLAKESYKDTMDSPFVHRRKGEISAGKHDHIAAPLLSAGDGGIEFAFRGKRAFLLK
jgi:hypothetical protein